MTLYTPIIAKTAADVLVELARVRLSCCALNDPINVSAGRRHFCIHMQFTYTQRPPFVSNATPTRQKRTKKELMRPASVFVCWFCGTDIIMHSRVR